MRATLKKEMVYHRHLLTDIAAVRGRIDENCSGLLTSYGYNLIGDAAGCILAGETTGNIVGRAPLLLPLGDNGDPTWTPALAPGSPAIDAGHCTDMGGRSPLLPLTTGIGT